MSTPIQQGRKVIVAAYEHVVIMTGYSDTVWHIEVHEQWQVL
jgi:hypothetical protein